MNTSRKQFAYESMDGETRYRILLPSDAPKYKSEEHFQWFEESDYLAQALKGIPYATYKTDVKNDMSELLLNGFVDKAKEKWVPFFAFWKENEGHAFMIPSITKASLETAGVHLNMKTLADIYKADKYVNRLFAALPKTLYGGVDPTWGEMVDWDVDGSFGLIELDNPNLQGDDKLITVKHCDLKDVDPKIKAALDGSAVCSGKFCRVTGLTNNPKLGDAWRITESDPMRFGKGHLQYHPELKHDLIIFGSKSIVQTEKFFFGSMGRLHAGDPHTDIQSFVNFHFHRPGLAIDLAKEFMREVIAASKDEDRLRRLFLRHTKDMKHSDMDQEAWILRRALAYGVSTLRFPGLYRRVVRYLLKKVLQCENARIPMQSETYGKALYAYVLPDPAMIDDEGVCHLDRGIPEGTIICPDVPAGTKVICYRQPNENSNAWVLLTVIHRPGYERYAGKGICLLGQGASEVLARLGGGDMDDQFVIVYDPKWVEAFLTMRKYPETEKISAEISEDEQEAYSHELNELDEFTDECLEDVRSNNLTQYCNKHVQLQMDMASKARAGIGMCVNWGMDDMLKSDPDQLESMLGDLKNHPEEYEALSEREPWQAAREMTNLEIIIDGNVKDATLLRKLGDVAGKIKLYHAAQVVYPQCFAGNALDVANGMVTEDKLRSRIPKSVALKGNFVVARSLTCKALGQIHNLAEKMQEIFIEREWALVSPADNDLRSYYPREKELVAVVRGVWKKVDGEWVNTHPKPTLIDTWNNLWREEMSQDKNHEPAYKQICARIMAGLPMDNVDLMERLAVELYYQTYKRYENSPKVDETTGKLRNYPDGLLWSPIFGDHFINALRKARLCGLYKVAEIMPEFKKRLIDKAVAVQIRDNSLFIQDSEDNFTVYVGMIFGQLKNGKLYNGKFRMDKGLVEFKKPDAICLPTEDYLIPAQLPLTRVFKAKSQAIAEAPAEKKEPTTLFGKLLKKVFKSTDSRASDLMK